MKWIIVALLVIVGAIRGAEVRHITQIADTKANLETYLDTRQIAITTDTVTGIGAKPLCFKDADTTFRMLPILGKNAYFNALTCTSFNLIGGAYLTAAQNIKFTGVDTATGKWRFSGGIKSTAVDTSVSRHFFLGGITSAGLDTFESVAFDTITTRVVLKSGFKSAGPVDTLKNAKIDSLKGRVCVDTLCYKPPHLYVGFQDSIAAVLVTGTDTAQITNTTKNLFPFVASKSETSSIAMRTDSIFVYESGSYKLDGAISLESQTPNDTIKVFVKRIRGGVASYIGWTAGIFNIGTVARPVPIVRYCDNLLAGDKIVFMVYANKDASDPRFRSANIFMYKMY